MKRFFFWSRGANDAEERAEADLNSSGLLTGNPDQDQDSLRILLESIADVSTNMHLDSVLEGMASKSLGVTDAERAIVLLGSSFDEMDIRLSRDREGTDLGADLQFSRSVVRRAVTEVQAVRSVVQSDQEALELGQSVFDLKLRAVMCAPLMVKERLLGAIYVDSRAQRREFSSRDLALFGALTAQLAVAVDNARLYADSLEKVKLEKDLEIAQRIQQHLLPPAPADVPGLDVALRYAPCEAASGDTYDFLPVGEDKLAVLIGDVTGHGLGAALLTHSAQAGMRSYLELLDDPSEVVTRLNNRLVAGVETGNFMSLALLVIDARARTLHYVNAGHPELVIARESGLESFAKTGMVLGVVADADYPVQGPIDLAPGDLIFLRTDGVEETMSTAREAYGEGRLDEVIASGRHLSADAVLAKLEEELTRHRGNQPREDDVTMIAIKVLGSSA
ncbi:MAG: PP2C family protein-serine/threonine phosphatase [Planctomycetota bacterium]